MIGSETSYSEDGSQEYELKQHPDGSCDVFVNGKLVTEARDLHRARQAIGARKNAYNREWLRQQQRGK